MNQGGPGCVESLAVGRELYVTQLGGNVLTRSLSDEVTWVGAKVWHGQWGERSGQTVQNTGKEMTECKGIDTGWFWGDEMA